ncbi:dnaJ homolog subfamily C member 15 isoform X1 [Mauremys reevesii]|uniref:dnaJ homolog subfamily C member 15 isoform X1 n=1 Tax=Mauremys reevesii TaxID=260615 RepID=UPI00193FE754|nr:dnaJ homolog subfamily C member 15 isoform X1 [Mauremys reevesii]
MEGAGAPSETRRYAHRRGEPDMDRGLARTMMTVGLGVAAVAFAGRYAFQVWKPLEQVFTETAKKIATSSFSSYYKGGFEQKMSRREASLILGIRWISLLSNKNKRSKRFVRLQHQKLMSKDFCDRTFYTFLSTENPVDILCNSYVLLYIAA